MHTTVMNKRARRSAQLPISPSQSRQAKDQRKVDEFGITEDTTQPSTSGPGTMGSPQVAFAQIAEIIAVRASLIEDKILVEVEQLNEFRIELAAERRTNEYLLSSQNHWNQQRDSQ